MKTDPIKGTQMKINKTPTIPKIFKMRKISKNKKKSKTIKNNKTLYNT